MHCTPEGAPRTCAHWVELPHDQWAQTPPPPPEGGTPTQTPPPGEHFTVPAQRSPPTQQNPVEQDEQTPVARQQPQSTAVGAALLSLGQSGAEALLGQQGTLIDWQMAPQWCWPAGQSLLPKLPLLEQQNCATVFRGKPAWQLRALVFW